MNSIQWKEFLKSDVTLEDVILTVDVDITYENLLCLLNEMDDSDFINLIDERTSSWSKEIEEHYIAQLEQAGYTVSHA